MTPDEPTNSSPRWQLRTPLLPPYGAEGFKRMRCEDCKGRPGQVFMSIFMHFCTDTRHRDNAKHRFGRYVYSSFTHSALSLEALAQHGIDEHVAAPLAAAA